MVSDRWHHPSFPHGTKYPQTPSTKRGKSSAQPASLSWRRSKGRQSQRLWLLHEDVPLDSVLFCPESGEALQTTCDAATLSRLQMKISLELPGALELGNNNIGTKPWVLVIIIRDPGSHLCTYLILLTMAFEHGDCSLHFIGKKPRPREVLWHSWEVTGPGSEHNSILYWDPRPTLHPRTHSRACWHKYTHSYF